LYVGSDFYNQYSNSNLKGKGTVNSVFSQKNTNNEILVKNVKEKITDDIIVYNRSTVIRQYMLGLKVQVYNGIRFFPLEVNPEMIGHCFGEFSPTRKKPVSKKKKKKK
jgi:small subunit ribosomal protein S19